jgi:hypothetical protein
MMKVKVNKDLIVRSVLTAIRIGGPIATVITGFLGGKKLGELEYTKDYADEDADQPLYFQELPKAKQAGIVLKHIAIPAACAGATIVAGCIDKSLDARKIGELTTACGSLMASKIAYQKKLKELDPKAAIEVEKETKESEEVMNPPTRQGDTPEIVDGQHDTLFISTLTGRQFYSSLDQVQAAIKTFRHEFNISCAYNERSIGLYRLQELLGIKVTYFGQQFGYVSVHNDDGSWDYNFCDEPNAGIMTSSNNITIVKDTDDDHLYYLGFEEAPIEGWYEI